MATLKLSLLGANIQQSRMPELLALLCDREGLGLEFDLADAAVYRYDFDARADRCRRAGDTGVIVTHPFKTRAFAGADAVQEVPAQLGAVNAIRFASDGWIATNTDYTGLLKAWAGTMDIAPGAVAMAGAGGVARVIAFALLRLGVTRLTLYDPEPGRAAAVAALCDPEGTRARAVGADGFRRAVAEADGLVNATPLGTAAYPGMAFEADAIGPQTWVFDAVYTPVETPFMQAASAAGLKRLTGFDLFLNMGIDSFEFFAGKDVDRAAVMPALRALAPDN